MALTYQKEDWIVFMEDCGELIVAHWQDVALDQATVELDPDWDTYNCIDAQGGLEVVTARDEGTLVGYSIHIISTHIHYKNLKIAEGDVFWLDSAYRRGMAGIKLLKAAEKHLVAIGVDKVINKVKLHKDVVRIFERLGYTAIERVYAKGLA